MPKLSSPEILITVMGASTFFIGLVWERLAPFENAWKDDREHVILDVIHSVVYVLLQPVTALLTAHAVAAFGVEIAWPWLDQPLWVRVIMLILFMEFLGYWNHRLHHQLKPLWRLHAVHHSADRVHVLNGLRLHPLNVFTTALLGLPIGLFFGMDVEALTLATVFLANGVILQHANIHIPAFLEPWFSPGKAHRFHHGAKPEEADRNYSQVILLWDAVFGTRYVPKDKAYPRVLGVHPTLPFPATYRGQLAAPFRRVDALDAPRAHHKDLGESSEPK